MMWKKLIIFFMISILKIYLNDCLQISKNGAFFSVEYYWSNYRNSTKQFSLYLKFFKATIPVLYYESEIQEKCSPFKFFSID